MYDEYKQTLYFSCRGYYGLFSSGSNPRKIDCWAKKASIQEFYSDKVQFGAISTVLKPDKPVRFAIKDKLIKKKYFDKYMALPEFKKLHNFLQNNLV